MQQFLQALSTNWAYQLIIASKIHLKNCLLKVFSRFFSFLYFKIIKVLQTTLGDFKDEQTSEEFMLRIWNNWGRLIIDLWIFFFTNSRRLLIDKVITKCRAPNPCVHFIYAIISSSKSKHRILSRISLRMVPVGKKVGENAATL